MLVDGEPMRTIWAIEGGVGIIDQTKLPHELVKVELRTLHDVERAIKEMWVRGAPLIGATAAYGMAIALAENPSDDSLRRAAEVLGATRPTAVNLRWALERIVREIGGVRSEERARAAFALAAKICEEDVAINRAIGKHGLGLIKPRESGRDRINILTHCNAGWLATVDVGTATAPIYAAHDLGIPVHVWVDETRPRNQGASLTAWELGKHGVPHTVIVDNAGGHLMQHGMVDLCIVGCDRVTATGDVANKIGTYLKALAARDNGVPFYVALPSPTIDWRVSDGVREIPIEQRDAREVTHVSGRNSRGGVERVCIVPEGSGAGNYAFDVTPGRLVTELITERGVCEASREGLLRLFAEKGEGMGQLRGL
jgi:methylthioribose-1-phosphate isomerase